MKHEYRVVVSGAGVAGLTFTAELLRQGIDPNDILLIDNQPSKRKFTKASVLHLRVQEILSCYDLTEKMQAYGNWITSASIISNGSVLNTNHLQLPLYSKHKGYIGTEQWLVEQTLLDYITSKGGQVYWSTEIQEFDQGDLIQVRVKHNNEIKTITTQYLVGSEGGKSTIRKHLGLSFVGESGSLAVAVHYKGDKLKHTDENTLNIYGNSTGVALSMGMPNGNWMVGMDVSTAEVEEYLSESKDHHGQHYFDKEMPDSFLSELIQKKLDPDFTGFDTVIWKSGYRIQNRIVDKFGNGKNIFLIGDAAHLTSPQSGSGMNYAIYDGNNLGWKLAMVLQKLALPIILDTFEQERRDATQALLQVTKQIDQLTTSLTTMSLFGKSVLSTMLKLPPFTILQEYQRLFGHGFSLTYKSLLSCDTYSTFLTSAYEKVYFDGQYGVGQRFNPCTLDSIKERFLTETSGFKVVYFADSIDTFEYAQRNTEHLLNKIKQVTDVVVVPLTRKEIYSTCKIDKGIMVIRPDGFVGLKTRELSFGSIAKYFNLFCPQLHTVDPSSIFYN
ncbi:hypothetical protein HDV04_005405 [Boothiomyces sp. JEL0838]|nr:hypothetical protein HDV04_005405 [Boothiomyces sp. JEL0838]